MRQLTNRLRPWAPTMLGVGLVSTLAESLQERDVTSIMLILMSLLGFLLLVRVKHGLTRGEVRAEIDAGIRARVRPEAMVHSPRVFPRRAAQLEDVDRTIDFSNKTT